MTRFVPVILLLLVAGRMSAAVFTNAVTADSFVRAALPASNYGGAGALCVSGATATNGSGVANGTFDSFIRFNTSIMVSNCHRLFGANWVVTEARLRVTEVGAPNNAIFNRGVGALEIRWIKNDDWVEGTGTPMAPATLGISFNDESSLLNTLADVPLGTFRNPGVDGGVSFLLALPKQFVGDVMEGSEVGVYLTAIDPALGFTFNARSFGLASARPSLEITVEPSTVISSIVLSGSNLTITATNGVSGQTYHLLSASEITWPRSQWIPLATNEWGASDSMSFVFDIGTMAGPRFYILEAR